ncbi:MAG: IPT/TIG domain-containing protein, partial [Acidimicrobiia bacterium]
VGESINDWGCRLLESNAWFAQTGTVDNGLIVNGGFETGNLNGWTGTPAAQVVVNATAKNTGSFGAQLNAFSGGSVTLKQVFSVTEGETICTSANIFPQSNYAAGQARTSMQALTSPFPFVAISPQLAGTNGGGLGPGEFKHVWAQGQVPDTTPNTTSVQVLYSVQPETDGGTVYFDDLAFFHGPCPLPSSGVQAPTITSFNPTSGNVGQAVTLTGTNLTGATAVKFNGTNATFTVNSATQISTTVPSGATDGTVRVTTPGGTTTSSTSFDVTTPPPSGLAISLKVAATDSVDRSTYTTASISPTANRWLVVDVGTDATTAPNVPTLSGGGLMYTMEKTQLGSINNGTTRRT